MLTSTESCPRQINILRLESPFWRSTGKVLFPLMFLLYVNDIPVYASVTFASVVVRFICRRFSLRFFRDCRGLKAMTYVFTLLTITLRFLRRQTRTKPYRDLADIVRQPQGYCTIIVLSSRPPYINRTMPVR